MSKIKTPKIRFVYLNKPESGIRLKRAYDRIFAIARRNIKEKERRKCTVDN